MTQVSAPLTSNLPIEKPEVPLEIIQAILQYLPITQPEDGQSRGQDRIHREALRACALASRIFLETCQRMLFSAITLQPVGTSFSSTGPLNSLDTFEPWGRLMESSPHLASYVRRLHFIYITRFNKQEKDLTFTAIKGIVKMKHLTHITMKFDRRDRFGHDFYTIDNSLFEFRGRDNFSDAVWILLKQPELQELVLRNVSITASALEHCTKLRSLVLNNSGFGRLYPISGRPDPDLPAIPISKLVFHSKLDTLVHFYRMDYAEGFAMLPIDFRAVKSLTVLVNPLLSEVRLGTPGFLLPLTEGLEQLHLSTRVPDFLTPTLGFMFPPLSGLNPLSFSTLIHIVFRSVHELGENSLQTPLNRDPYLGLLDGDVFPQLKALEHLEFDVSVKFQDLSDRDGLKEHLLGEQWSALDTVIFPSDSAPARFPRLKKVALLVEFIEDLMEGDDVEALEEEDDVTADGEMSDDDPSMSGEQTIEAPPGEQSEGGGDTGLILGEAVGAVREVMVPDEPTFSQELAGLMVELVFNEQLPRLKHISAAGRLELVLKAVGHGRKLSSG